MSTGTKLTKLRKDANYTQEALAEILGVSRQSISKWESDLSYPETDKLIQLAKLYKCSLDYLMLDENSKAQAFNEDEESQTKVKNSNGSSLFTRISQKPQFPTLLWSLGFVILSFIIYSLPFLQMTMTIGYPFTPTTVYVDVNFYQIIGAASYQLGNFFYLLVFLLMLGEGVLALITYFKPQRKYHLTRTVFSSIQVFVLLAVLVDTPVLIGHYLITLLVIANLVGQFFIKFNKYSK